MVWKFQVERSRIIKRYENDRKKVLNQADNDKTDHVTKIEQER